jgi:hypothetical protein
VGVGALFCHLLLLLPCCLAWAGKIASAFYPSSPTFRLLPTCQKMAPLANRQMNELALLQNIRVAKYNYCYPSPTISPIHPANAILPK